MITINSAMPSPLPRTSLSSVHRMMIPPVIASEPPTFGAFLPRKILRHCRFHQEKIQRHLVWLSRLLQSLSPSEPIRSFQMGVRFTCTLRQANFFVPLRIPQDPRLAESATALALPWPSL